MPSTWARGLGVADVPRRTGQLDGRGDRLVELGVEHTAGTVSSAASRRSRSLAERRSADAGCELALRRGHGVVWRWRGGVPCAGQSSCSPRSSASSRWCRGRRAVRRACRGRRPCWAIASTRGRRRPCGRRWSSSVVVQRARSGPALTTVVEAALAWRRRCTKPRHGSRQRTGRCACALGPARGTATADPRRPRADDRGGDRRRRAAAGGCRATAPAPASRMADGRQRSARPPPGCGRGLPAAVVSTMRSHQKLLITAVKTLSMVAGSLGVVGRWRWSPRPSAAACRGRRRSP